MARTRAIFQNLLYPPRWVRFLVPAAAFPALWALFAAGRTRGAAACAVYGLSAYAQILLLAGFPQHWRWIKTAIRTGKAMQRIRAHPVVVRYRRDLAFRGRVSLCQSMTVHFCGAGLRLAAGLRDGSAWFFSLAVYELILGALHMYLIRCDRRPQRMDRCCRTAAGLLLLLHLPMGGMILLMVQTNAGFSYPGHIIYLSALYTFYTVTMSVVNLVRFRRLGNPILSVAKALNLLAALMSVLGLQTAMIARFSENGAHFRKMLNAVTGGAVYGVGVAIAVGLLLRSRSFRKEAESVESVRK